MAGTGSVRRCHRWRDIFWVCTCELVFGFTVGALNPCSNRSSRILDLGMFFGGLLFTLAVIELLANFFAGSCFGVIAEGLLYAVRVLSFRSLVEQGVQ
jgi:hypothetical protein